MKKILLPVIMMLILISVSAKSQITTVKELRQKYYEKCGTLEEFQKITTLKLTGTQILPTAGLEGSLTISIIMPDQIRQDVEIMGVMCSIVINKKSGWTVDPINNVKKPEDIPSEELEGMTGEMSILFETPFFHTKDDAKANIDSADEKWIVYGIDKIDGKDCYKLKMKISNDKVEFFAYFDKENLFFVKFSTVITDKEGKKHSIDYNLGNHQKVGNVYLPFSYEHTIDSQSVENIILDKIESNVKVDVKIFNKP